MKLSDMLFANAMMGEGGGGGGGGSSDFSTCTMTVTGASAEGAGVVFPTVYEEEGFAISIAYQDVENGTYTVILYKGACAVAVQDPTPFTVSGNATYEGGGGVIVTGDFTITFT